MAVVDSIPREFPELKECDFRAYCSRDGAIKLKEQDL